MRTLAFALFFALCLDAACTGTSSNAPDAGHEYPTLGTAVDAVVAASCMQQFRCGVAADPDEATCETNAREALCHDGTCDNAFVGPDASINQCITELNASCAMPSDNVCVIPGL